MSIYMVYEKSMGLWVGVHTHTNTHNSSLGYSPTQL